MRPTRTLPLALLAALAALVSGSGCAEELVDTGSEPIVDESADTGLGLAADGADGDPPAWEGEDSLPPWEGEGPPPWADDIPGEPDSIVHPTRARIDLTITATGPLSPGVGVALTIEGVAREEIDGGEVVLTLPTRAIMDHALDTGVPEVPAKARWDLPPMAKGDIWSGAFTVPSEAAGYYRVLVNAYPHGPDGGPWLFDDVGRQAWMFVSETGGQLTRHFEESLFPEGIHPVPGPATAIAPPDPDDGAVYSRPASNSTNNWHPDSVFLRVLYYNDWRKGYRIAVGMELYGWEYQEPDGRTRRNPQGSIVPEDGIVAFGCPPEGWYLRGKGDLPETDYAKGRHWVIPSWWADRSDCGRLKMVDPYDPAWYIAWRHLNVGGERISKHFGHWREEPVDWNVNFSPGYSSRYTFWNDKITLNGNLSDERYAHYVAAHEYGHALHHKALGGGWFIRSFLQGCSDHQLNSEESHKCALQEGFAVYAGSVGADGYYDDCLEHFGDPTKPVRDSTIPGYSRCRQEADKGKKPKIEGHVAALFHDLTDDTWEKGDWTEYPGKYIAEVFKTCKTKSRYKWMWNPITGWSYYYIWWGRSNVSNIVWCLENYIEPAYHESDSVFESIGRPWDFREKSTKPPSWRRSDIRSTWLKNLN